MCSVTLARALASVLARSAVMHLAGEHPARDGVRATKSLTEAALRTGFCKQKLPGHWVYLAGFCCGSIRVE